jgi:Pentapeptide repeats (8 copies)
MLPHSEELQVDQEQQPSKQEKEPDKRPSWWKRLWARTGFGDKTLWDLLQLLIAPLVLVGIGFLFEMQQAAREEARAEAERNLAEQRAQDEALQAYLDQMSSLLLNGELRASEEGSEVRTLARARTLTVLGRLNPSRKTDVMQFLLEAELVQRVEGGRGPIITLIGANLSGADLSEADLVGALLINANLINAGGVTEEQLEEQAQTLEGTTMPDGSKHP